MPDVIKRAKRFICRGVDLNSPVDQVKPNKFPILENIRSYQDGRLEARPGLSRIASVIAGQTNVHSVRRLNDDVAGAAVRVVGVGTRLARGLTTFFQEDTGYSGNPLALTPLRPDQAPNPWMYVADSSRMRKLRQDGTLHGIGVASPTAPPTIALDVPRYNSLEDFESYANDMALQAAWVEGGDAGNPTLQLRVDSAAVTITRILYDSGTTGWASVQPSSMVDINPGMRLTVNVGGGTEEAVTVQNVYSGATSTTIGRILYDSGTTGACSIIPATPVKQIRTNSLIRLSASETVRVEAVIPGPDGTESIRATTTSNHVNGATLDTLNSFRAYFNNNHAAAETLRSRTLQSVFTFSTGSGTLTRTASFDLSFIATGTAATQKEDYLHVDILLSDISAVTEGKILFDVDSGTNDFTRNYYFFSFRPADLVPAAEGTIPVVDNTFTEERRRIREQERAQQRRQRIQQLEEEARLASQSFIGQPDKLRKIQEYARFKQLEEEFRLASQSFIGQPDKLRTLRRTSKEINRILGLDDPLEPFPTPPPRDIAAKQMGSGDNQWYSIRFHVSELTRVGEDQSRTLADVAAIRVQMDITSTVTVSLDSIWLGGGFGPDVDHLGSPYFYRYRGRVSSTGAKSNPSPATRAGIQAFRQHIIVSLPLLTGEVDKLDVERFGGNLTEWHYVGTAENTGSPQFIDIFSDDVIAVNLPLGFDNFQPWPLITSPAGGTGTAVAGTTLQDTGATFTASWAPGTRIKVNGIDHTIYRVISTSLLELVENAGSAASPVWEIPEPVLLGQPLHALWGPFEGFVFACGDSNNPGRLYFSKGNDYDSTRETHWIDVTSPSEPLQNGVTYNGRAYVWSTERMFAIYPAFRERQLFRVLEIPNGKGLFARWAFTGQSSAEGPKIWFLARDGIYETTGGEPVNITQEDLNPLFPHEGVAGVATNGFNPPDLAQTAALRLSYHNSWLYFDYLDTAAARRSLVYHVPTRSWFPDVYTPGLIVHYGEEGQGLNTLLGGGTDTPDSGLYQSAGTADDVTAIACHIRTPSHDEGDPRTGKFYSEFMLDGDTNSVSVSVTAGFDYHATTLGPFSVSTASRLRTQVDLNSGDGQHGFNMSLDITWSTTGVSPQLYFWEPLFELSADILANWIRQTTTHGFTGFQHIRDAYVELISTAAVTFTIDVDGTDHAFTITSTAGARRKIYVPTDVIKGKVFNYLLTSSAAFRLFREGSEVRVKLWGDPGPYQIARPFGDPS